MPKKPGAVVIVSGVVVPLVLVFAGCSRFLTHGNDAEATIVLSGSPCTITAADKPTTTTVGKTKKVTWHVTNNCTGSQTVMLGNFRAPSGASAANCTEPTQGGASWPFKDQDADASQRTANVPETRTGDITLKEAKNPGTTKLEYDYDVCLGGARKDPRLVIDPY